MKCRTSPAIGPHSSSLSPLPTSVGKRRCYPGPSPVSSITPISSCKAYIFTSRASPGTEDRIRTALKNFDLPEGTMIDLDSDATLMVSLTDLDTVYRNPLCFMDINYWAFRDASNTHKLSIGQITADTLAETEPYPDISSLSPDARLYDMKASTLAQFRHAIKQLMGAPTRHENVIVTSNQ